MHIVPVSGALRGGGLSSGARRSRGGGSQAAGGAAAAAQPAAPVVDAAAAEAGAGGVMEPRNEFEQQLYGCRSLKSGPIPYVNTSASLGALDTHTPEQRQQAEAFATAVAACQDFDCLRQANELVKPGGGGGGRLGGRAAHASSASGSDGSDPPRHAASRPRPVPLPSLHGHWLPKVCHNKHLLARPHLLVTCVGVEIWAGAWEAKGGGAAAAALLLHSIRCNGTRSGAPLLRLPPIPLLPLSLLLLQPPDPAPGGAAPKGEGVALADPAVWATLTGLLQRVAAALHSGGGAAGGGGGAAAVQFPPPQIASLLAAQVCRAPCLPTHRIASSPPACPDSEHA